MSAKDPTNSYGWLGVHWVEHITKAGSTATYSFSPNQQQLTFTIRVKFDEFPQAVSELMGYSFVSGVPLKLRRAIPKAHPLFPWLYCVGVSQVVGIGPKKEPKLFKNNADVVTGAIQDYEYALLTCHFSTVPYTILTDTELFGLGGQEWRRFTTRRFKPFVNLAVTEKGMYKFAEGPGAGPPPVALDVGLSKAIRKTVITLDWFDVPWRAVYNPSGYPTNLEAAVGRVNFNEFLGFPTGTLLCLPYEITEHVSGSTPLNVQLQNGVDPPLLYNVSLSFEIYQPDVGGAFQGHNTVPYKIDGLNYLVTTTGGALGTKLFEYYDFDKIFQIPV